MEKQLISVIIPVYNVEAYLEASIESVLNQTYKELEIILVDDGSTDNCGRICDDYAKNDKRIKVIHKENGGLSDARNCGLQLAQGSIIGFVDSDDIIEKHMYETLYKLMIENDCDIAMSTFRKNGCEDAQVFSGNVEVFSKDEMLTYYVQGYNYYRISPAVWQRIYKKSVIGDSVFPVGRCYEDLVWSAEVINRCNKVVFVDEPLYLYSIRQDSITGKDYKNAITKRVITDHLEQYKDEIKFFEQINRKDLAVSVNYHYYFKITECIYNIREFKNEELYKYLPMLKKERSRLNGWALSNCKSMKTGRQKIKVFLAVLLPVVFYQYQKKYM